ncbi:hypothetical protein H5410_014875, partial [Solanum commersonii]
RLVCTISTKIEKKLKCKDKKVIIDRLTDPVGPFDELQITFDNHWFFRQTLQCMRVPGMQIKGDKNTFRESPSAFGALKLLTKNYRTKYQSSAKLTRDGDIRRTAKSFGKLDLAHQSTQCAYFRPIFSNSIPQPRKIKSKHALMEF